jgi:acyl-CoA synthetase (AMP-forming)/AMP-acid ligase II
MRSVLTGMESVPTAVRTLGGDWSGPELIARAAGAGRQLTRIAAPGTPLPALFGASAQSVAFTLGGALSDRPLAPLGTRLSTKELSALVRGIGGSILLADEANLGLARKVAAMTAGVTLVAISDPPAADPDFVPTSADSVVLVLHTSGTTGRPKRVDVRDSAIFHRSRAYHREMGLGPGDLYCSTGGFHHTGGVGMLFVAAACGAGLVPFPRFSVEAWKAVAGLRPTCALLVPTMIDLLLERRALDAVALRALHYGTAPIHPATLAGALEAIPGTEFTQAYGMTEGGPLSLLVHADHVRAAAGETGILSSVGRILDNVEHRFDEVDGDGVGELVARAPQIFQPDPDGWLRTGDLGHLDDEGFLHLCGRRGDKLIRGGENVYPLEVERVLEKHPAVSEAAVIGVASRRWGQTLKAFVVPKPTRRRPDATELADHVRHHLAGFKVPEEWAFVDQLPRNPAGKLLRGDLS